MAYADYYFYITAYMGTAINSENFPRLALRASAFLDYYTQGRAADNSNLDALKMACCALAERYQAIETAQKLADKALTAAVAAGGAELQSQTVGGWSKSYRSGGGSAAEAFSAANSAQASLADTARRYLAGTGLVYRGGRRCEDE